MKIKFKYFDKLFKITNSTPLDFYKFMQLGIKEGDFPCNRAAYMGKYYLEDEGGAYQNVAGGSLWEIIPKEDIPDNSGVSHINKFIKAIIPLPLFVDVINEFGHDVQSNSCIYHKYRINLDFQKLLNKEFITHYKLTKKETNL